MRWKTVNQPRKLVEMSSQTTDEVLVDNPSEDAFSIPISHPLVSASNYLTVLPVETEFDSKAQAVVLGSVDGVTEQDSTDL